ncbi:MAG: DMT family transporter [Thermomicrobiales bacterium]
MSRDRAIAIAQTLGILILMSLGTVITKLALGDVKPLTFVAFSILIAMTTLGWYTFVYRGERIPRGVDTHVWFLIAAIGIGNFAVSRVMSTLSLDLMSATTNAFLMNFVGFVTMAMSIFILKESPSFFQILGAVIAIVGLRVFFAEVPSADEFLGIFFLSLCILATAYTNNAARKLMLVNQDRISTSVISTLALLIGGSVAVVVCFALEWPPRLTGWGNWGVVVYSGVVVSALGLTVWNHVLRVLRSYEASILGVSTVIWTTLFAIPILGESLNGHQLAGMALLVLGLACVQIRRQFSPFVRKERAVSIPDDGGATTVDVDP